MKARGAGFLLIILVFLFSGCIGKSESSVHDVETELSLQEVSEADPETETEEKPAQDIFYGNTGRDH